VEVKPFPDTPDEQAIFDDVTSDLNTYSGKYVRLSIRYDLLATELDLEVGQVPHVDIENGTYLTYRMSASGEYWEVPAAACVFLNSDEPVPEDIGSTLRVPIINHHLTWHRVVNPPWTAIKKCLGCLNGAADTAFPGMADETLLFDAPVEATREFLGFDTSNNPNFGYALTYTFCEKIIKAMNSVGELQIYGWNHVYRTLPKNNPGWDVLMDMNGNYQYRTANFASLFKFEQSA